MPHNSAAARAVYNRAYRQRHRAQLLAGKRRWYLANRSRCLAKSKAWVEEHRKQSNAIKSKWDKKNPHVKRLWSKTDRLNNRARWAHYAREGRRRLSWSVFTIYGGRCACCAEPEFRFLTLDHIANNGAAMRRASGLLNNQIYRSIRKSGKPLDGFQVLCANCNLGKQWNGGVCPHATPSPRPAQSSGRSLERV